MNAFYMLIVSGYDSFGSKVPHFMRVRNFL